MPPAKRRRACQAAAKHAPAACSRERLPVTVELLLDGKPLYQAVLPPTGVRRRRAVPGLSALRRAAGRHELIARLRDSDRQDGFDYERTATIELAPAQSLAIDFRPEMGGFVFR